MRHRFRLGPAPLVVSVAVVVLGIALVMGGFLSDDDTELNLGALGSTTTGVPTSTSTSTSVSTIPTVVPTLAESPTTVAAAASPSTAARRSLAATTTTTIRPPVSPVTAIPTTKATTTTAITVAPPPTTTVPVPVSGARQASVEAEVVTLTNVDRSANGVGPLTRNSCMDQAAAQWAAHMAQTGEKAHNSQSGALVQGCRGGDAFWGDNIGWWDPCSAAKMENWWMNSSGHRRNVLSTNYTVIGVAVIPGVQNYCWFQVLFGS